MKIVIVGGTGLLGSSLVKLYTHLEIEVIAFSRKNSSNIASKHNRLIDFLHLASSLNTYCVNNKPQIIINAVALVNLQKCEEEPTLCHESNVKTSLILAKVAKQHKSYFIHISTDHFYTDNKLKHTEKDPLALINNYAKTKREAEEKVLNIYPQSLVVRTNIIGFRHTSEFSFFEWLIQSLKEQKQLDLYTDFFTSPISTKTLGTFLLKCYDKNLQGIYNIASSEVIDKYNFGLALAKHFNFSTQCIQKSSIYHLQSKSSLQRATSLGLNIEKIETALGLKMPSIETTLTSLFDEYLGDKIHAQ